MLTKELKHHVETWLKKGDFKQLNELFRTLPAVDVAEAIRPWSLSDKIQVIEELPVADSAKVFTRLPYGGQYEIAKTMGQENFKSILMAMAFDERTGFLQSLPPEETNRMLALLPEERRGKATRLLSYRKDSVGRLMTPDFVAIQENWTVRETFEHIRTYGRDSETLNALYVVDANGRLLDDIKIRELLLHPLETIIKDLRKHRKIILHVDDTVHRAATLFRKYNRTVLPVVDADRQLLGILTVDDILNITEKMNTRTIQSIGGSEALNEPYLSISLVRMFRKRGGWLVILFVGEMLTATAMSFFEAEIARAVVLALFVPLIISSGGNSGSQASTLIIRALALGEIQLRDWWKVLRRELITGLSLGSLLGIIGVMRISLWSLIKPIYGPHWPWVRDQRWNNADAWGRPGARRAPDLLSRPVAALQFDGIRVGAQRGRQRRHGAHVAPGFCSCRPDWAGSGGPVYRRRAGNARHWRVGP